MPKTPKRIRPHRIRKRGPRKGSFLQVAALCYRGAGPDLRVLLVTSRQTKRWIVPKGWPMKRMSKREAALREAYEEAGVEGVITGKSLGFFAYSKVLRDGLSIRCSVQVFPVEVTKLKRTYPELGQRKRKWFKPKKAANRLSDPQMAVLLRQFAAHPNKA
ncbi:MAG: NUDIX hydrolase [Pseudomonadota bacterium]